MILKSDSEPIEEVVKPEVPRELESEAVSHNGTQPTPPRKSRRERLIERATAPLLEKIKQLEAGRTQGAAPAQPEAVAAQPKPKRAEFASDEDFEDALVAWGNEKFAAEKAEKDAQAARQQYQDAQRQYLERNLRSYAAQVKEAKETYPDWDEVVNQDVFIGTAVQLAVLELDNAADIIYWLGKHPADAAKLGQMTPPRAIIEVGILSAKLKTGVSSNGEGYEYRRPKPRIPAPVRTVSTGGTSTGLTFAEIAAKPPYPGKARDLKIAAAAERG
jgi:hypothetical protein